MKMPKCFLIASLLVSSTLFSQTLTDAVKQTTNEQFTKADASFNALLAAQPSNGDLYFYYGENHFKSGNTELANKVYQKGADVNATNPLPYIGLGKVQWYQGKTPLQSSRSPKTKLCLQLRIDKLRSGISNFLVPRMYQ